MSTVEIRTHHCAHFTPRTVGADDKLRARHNRVICGLEHGPAINNRCTLQDVAPFDPVPRDGVQEDLAQLGPVNLGGVVTLAKLKEPLSSFVGN